MAKSVTTTIPDETLDIHATVSYPRRKNNTIRTFMEGKDFYTALYQRCKFAKYSIWCAVSFGSWSFQFPNGQHWWQYFKQLKEANPNLIIRVLIWRNIDKRWQSNGVIMGTEKDSKFIKDKKLLNKTTGIQFKWDESPEPAHCHHGKYFVIDAENDKSDNLSQIYAFVGGMTLNKIVYSDSRHDTVIEIHGPSTVDVINNYKLRWNNNNIFNKCVAMETCKLFTNDIADYVYIKNNNQQPLIEEKKNGDGDKDDGNGDNDDGVNCQVCTTIYPKIYPGYDLGESSIHYQYYKAFYNATKSIYIESQHPGDYYLLKLMKWKLETIKDFKIIQVVPINMMHPIVRAKWESMEYIKQCNKAKLNGNNDDLPKEPRYHSLFSTLGSLGEFKNFTLAGMYKSSKIEKKAWYESVYVHSKLSVVDGEWFTIGSANFVDISFIHDHSELNCCVFDKVEAMKLLIQLAMKHCEKKEKTFKKMNDAQIINYMMKMANKNVKAKDKEKVLDGRLCALDPELYAS